MIHSKDCLTSDWYLKQEMETGFTWKDIVQGVPEKMSVYKKVI